VNFTPRENVGSRAFSASRDFVLVGGLEAGVGLTID
jgi:hypothetical protein